ncbi:cytochrome C biogenesis protein [Jannaschia sp. EhC01]|nr:cytochrome C biogenesis protein [Jannaschia sp. EhC01]
MEYKDYYKILGVERGASQDDIKRSYRKLVRKYHPDVNTGPDAAAAEVKFKDVGEAYEVLQDPEKRAAYDQLGANWQEGQSFRPPPDWDDGFEFSGGGYTQADPEAFSSFFEDLFARRGAQGASMGARAQGPSMRSERQFHAAGQDHHAKIVIDLDEAYNGGTRDFTLRAPELDSSGHVVLRERKVRVAIPKGVKEGQHIRLAGKGAPGIGRGQPGDLYLEVALREDPIYRVEGRDVFMDLPITPWEAALGAHVDLRTPGGKVDLKIPKHAQSGKKLRLKGRGIPGKPAGNFYAVLKIVIPPTETEKGRALYEQMAEEMDFDPRKGMGG